MRVAKSLIQKIPWMVSLLFILLFVYAAVSKLLDFENFKIQIGQSPMLTNLAGVIAYCIPIIELLLALTLAVKRFRSFGLYSSVGLMVSFSMYIAVILNYSAFIPCSCGGILDSMSWTEHLIFNLGFVVLGVVGIILNAPNQKSSIESQVVIDKSGFCPTVLKKRVLIPIIRVIVLSCGFVLGLFFYTDYKNHLPGSFVRIFPPHVISEINAKMVLEKDQFQFTGFTKNHVYLNKKENPLMILQLDYNLSKVDTIFLKIPNLQQLNLSRTELFIDDMGIFMTDGSKPTVLKGNAKDWSLKVIDLENNYFNLTTVIDTNLLAITKLVPERGRVLGLVNTNNLNSHLNDFALEKQFDGFFCTDGFMHYNPELQKLIYTYYYRNEYVLMNKDLRVTARHKTIDTTATAKIKLSSEKNDGQRSLATPPPIVNRRSFSQGRWLFNQSNIRAKNELPVRFKSQSVIDVYDLTTGTYILSFYVPHIQGQVLRDFRIKNDELFILYPTQLVRYELTKKYLTSSISER